MYHLQGSETAFIQMWIHRIVYLGMSKSPTDEAGGSQDRPLKYELYTVIISQLSQGVCVCSLYQISY